MRRNKSIALLTAVLIAGTAVSPVLAQGYNDGRYNDRYNDQNDNGPDYGPPPPAQNDNSYDRGYREGQNSERYRHDMRTDDDAYYNRCRQQRANNRTGGLIIGALAGGLLGNALGRGGGRAPATVFGAIGGGAIGASIGGNLNCEDRNYAYRAYYSGFEAGRPHARYDWRSPRSGAYGSLEVGDYYRDRDGFRCATYSQTIYVNGRPEVAHGYACRQRDGYWAFVG